MDDYLSFNRKSIDDRQIDTLIGLAKGMLADGVLVQAEAEFLYTWLVQSRQATSHPIIINLFDRVRTMFQDGMLDDEERSELMTLLQKLTGDPAELGEFAKSSTLPLCNPPPAVAFDGRSFLFTGTCAYGTRRECEGAVTALGGLIAPSVNKKLNYLVIGTYVTDSWIHETFGRKIEKAMEYRADGLPLSIITEAHWARASGLIVD